LNLALSWPSKSALTKMTSETSFADDHLCLYPSSPWSSNDHLCC
jgi:hypothetical protein